MTIHELIDRLRAAGIHFALTNVRDNTVMFQIAVPGERWEVELLEDGSVEVERFRSLGEIDDSKTLDELFASFSDNR